MPASVFNTRRGSTLIVPLEAAGALDDDIGEITIDAGLKPAAIGLSVPVEAIGRIATFVATPRLSVKGVGPGWNLTMPAAQTAALAPGDYIMDAALTLPSGAVVLTAPLIIRIAQGVSR